MVARPSINSLFKSLLRSLCIVKNNTWCLYCSLLNIKFLVQVFYYHLPKPVATCYIAGLLYSWE